MTETARNMKRLSCGILACAVLVVAWGQAARGEEGPSIAKDSVRVQAAHISGSEDAPKEKQMQWKPEIWFNVNGPVADGSQLTVEFSYPGHKEFSKFSCKASETPAGEVLKIDECFGPDKFTTDYVGPVDFSINRRNELQGGDKVLFSGKANVGKFVGPAGPQYPEFYVDEDWRIPIGYLSYEYDDGHRASFFTVRFWYRGNPAEVNAHLFYKGKEIAKSAVHGNTGSDWKPNTKQWGWANCSFLGVYKDDPGDEGYDPKFAISKNPGDYEVKVLIDGHLARSIKFAVKSGGGIENGIAEANKLGSAKTVVPVQVIGNQTKDWDQTAWQTGAFYGNPLVGFTAVAPAGK